MEIIRPIYKPLGLTPLEAISRLKAQSPELMGIPLTYAGRLDPMAEGVVLVLGGEAIARKEEFLNLPKTYEAEILLGFSSDTFDALGIVSDFTAMPDTETRIDEALTKILGKHTYPYPLYSSKPVNGKPLWQWVREGKIKGLKIPTTVMDVYSAKLLQTKEYDWLEIYAYIDSAISKVVGDFRQPEILSRWADVNQQMKVNQTVITLKIQFIVGSGTYIRTLAHSIGTLIRGKAILLKLNRTRVGTYLASPAQPC